MSRADLRLLCRDENPATDEHALAQRLQIPLLSADAADEYGDAFLLRAEPIGLTLYAPGARLRGGQRVDFAAPALLRRAKEGLRRQGLGKAVGLKSGARPDILDATGGFGTDAFLLAWQGCRLQVWERSRLVYEMLEDGWRRASERPETRAVMDRISLQHGEYGPQGAESAVDVVYLDPMFPEPQRRARSKKAMDLLQRLLPETDDEAALLARAGQDAERRVVVKRPRHAPDLAGVAADLSFSGRSNRYDVYLQS